MITTAATPTNREQELRDMLARHDALDHVLAGGDPAHLSPAAQQQLATVQVLNARVLTGAPPLTRAQVEAELAAVQRAQVETDERERQERAEHEAGERAEQERRMQVAVQRATAAARDGEQAQQQNVAAHAALDELIAASPLGAILNTTQARIAAAGELTAALATLGPVAVGGTLNDGQRALLERLGASADSVRAALPEGHPARLHAAPRAPLRYEWLIRHLLTVYHTNGGGAR